MFSFEFCEISSNTFSYRAPLVAAFNNIIFIEQDLLIEITAT